jgi:hypothetical protein
VEIIADNVQFLGAAPDTAPQNGTAAEPADSDELAGVAANSDDEDIPF